MSNKRALTEKPTGEGRSSVPYKDVCVALIQTDKSDSKYTYSNL